MPRSIRIEYPGGFYHVMARGNRREQIFRSDHDRKLFLETLDEACDMTGWRIHAWVLMSSRSSSGSGFICQELMPDPSLRWL